MTLAALLDRFGDIGATHAGADHLLVRAEPWSTTDLRRVLSQIRSLGKKAGMALNPASPIDLIEFVLHLCDIVLVMTVSPGFGGQKFLPGMLPKIRHLRQLCQTCGLDPFIEVDGGEDRESAGQATHAGATAIVAGSAIFGSGDYSAAITALRYAPRASMRAATPNARALQPFSLNPTGTLLRRHLAHSSAAVDTFDVRLDILVDPHGLWTPG